MVVAYAVTDKIVSAYCAECDRVCNVEVFGFDPVPDDDPLDLHCYRHGNRLVLMTVLDEIERTTHG